MSKEPVQLPEALAYTASLVVNVAKIKTYDTYIGRTFAGRVDEGWGNPFPIKGNSARARVEAVEAWWESATRQEDFLTRARALEGRTLGCWCAPTLCHGHALAGVAAGNEYAVDEWITQLAAVAHATPKRLLVTGSRKWKDRQTIEDQLQRAIDFWGMENRPVLVVGDATGADAIAAAWWQAQGLTVEMHKADWDKLGRKAGALRNREMVDSGIDAAFAFPENESPGTRDCIKAATKAGIPIRIHEGYTPSTHARR